VRACWDFPPGLVEEARKRSAWMARHWGDLPFEDLLSEALIWAALHGPVIVAHLDADPAKGMDNVGRDIFRHLQKACVIERRQRGGRDCLSFEEWRDRVAEVT
jgi:hypothetical protein